MNTLLTIAKADGALEEVDNPRWLKARLGQLKELSRSISAEEMKIRAACGLSADAPIHCGQRSKKLNRLRQHVDRIHAKVTRQRKDFYRQLTTRLVGRFAFLGTKALAVQHMSKAPKAKPDPTHRGAVLAQRRGSESRAESWHP